LGDLRLQPLGADPAMGRLGQPHRARVDADDDVGASPDRRSDPPRVRVPPIAPHAITGGQWDLRQAFADTSVRDR
jgi:hypothetical protein